MSMLLSVQPKNVFKYFEEICAIPHGSGDMDKISQYCMNFAKEHGLMAVCDDARNVIIYKDGTKGYESAEPVILQGHLDMVCQKTDESTVDFEKDGIEAYVEDGFVRAKDTTLGADNGIAVSMVLAILASEDISHPPIEAVFTTDEEVGMIGAGKMDTSVLKSKKMINLDAEEEEFVTVSCAGGSDFRIFIPAEKRSVKGQRVVLKVKDLKGGHSGVEIDKGRVNANILMGRVLSYANEILDFDIIKITGGNKGNAIPRSCEAEIVTTGAEDFAQELTKCLSVIKKEIEKREPEFSFDIKECEAGTYDVLADELRDRLLYMLFMSPDGIVKMSAEIDDLVETSLNLGILETKESGIIMHYALRSNKASALDALTDKLKVFAKYNECRYETSGRYEPWEYRADSPLRDLYVETYEEICGKKPEVAAIHAGIECAVFASAIDGLDCIAIGPDMFGVHTTEEKLSIESTQKIFNLLCRVLEKSK